MSSPALNENTFSRSYDGTKMTYLGVALKTYFLLAVLLGTFVFTWDASTKGYTESFKESIKNPIKDAEGKVLPTQIDIPSNVYGYAVAGSLIGFVLAMMIIFNQQSAPYLSPFYAACEGVTLGAISAGFEARYPGIVLEAGFGTFGILAMMLVLYSTRVIQATNQLVVGLVSAMFGILLMYIAGDVMLFFGFGYNPVTELTEGNSWGSFALSTVIVLVASLNFIIDFDQIERGVERGAPKYMEWYASFSLMVSLVWLYLELLRWLAKLKSKD